MIALPIDPSLVFVTVSEPMPQIKDRETGEVATDRFTGVPLVQVNLALTTADGRAQLLQVSMPKNGVPEELPMGTLVRASELMVISGEKNSRKWVMTNASGLTLLAA